MLFIWFNMLFIWFNMLFTWFNVVYIICFNGKMWDNHLDMEMLMARYGEHHPKKNGGLNEQLWV